MDAYLTERDKMLRGEPYDSYDPELLTARFAARLDATVTVACGIHLDAIRPGEFKDILEMAEELAAEALERI